MQLRSFDFESLSEAKDVLSREWSKHDIVQSDHHSFRLKFRKRSITPCLSLNSLTYGSEVKIDPDERDPVILVMLPQRGSGLASFPGEDVSLNPSQYAVVDVRSVSNVRCGAGLDMLVLRISISRLRSYLESGFGILSRKELEFVPRICRRSDAFAGWAPIVAALSALHANVNPNISQRILEPFEEMILATLLIHQPNAYSEEISRPIPSVAPKHVRRAADYVREHAGEPLTTELLARSVGVSIRALFDGFKSFRGMTPTEYVRSVRLECVRVDLIGGEACVSEIARKWGFHHIGNFATHYRKRYGELPSQTLRSQNAKPS